MCGVLSCNYSLVEKSVGKASKRQNRFAPFAMSLISLYIKETSKKDLGRKRAFGYDDLKTYLLHRRPTSHKTPPRLSSLQSAPYHLKEIEVLSRFCGCRANSLGFVSSNTVANFSSSSAFAYILKELCNTYVCMHAYTLYILYHTCPDREMWILDSAEQSKTEA